MAGVLKKTTGLVGLAVSQNPHERLRILYSKILASLQTIPKDAAYRTYTEQLINDRFDLVKSEPDIEKLERKINCGQIEEVIVQERDLQYLLGIICATQSALSAWDDLYDLVMVQWNKYFEWSPWNCILLTKEEAAAHLKLDNVEQAYGVVFIRKMKHKHTLAKTSFSQIPTMAQFLHSCDCQPAAPGNDLLVTKPAVTQA
ncbi:UNVERIFIED_CONTAM: hypothetical protein FKN15_000458 [Acipenser sinensis]